MVTQAEEILKRLVDGPAGRKIAGEIEKERLSRRQELADEIKTIRDESATKAPDLAKAVEEAEAKAIAAHEIYKEALQGCDQARGALRNNSVDREIGRLEGELRQTADVETIDAFKAKLDVLGDQLRSGFYNVGPTTYRGKDGHDHVKEAGNVAQVGACLGHWRDAWREAVDTVQLMPLDGAALKVQLDRLWRAIKLPKH